jgi:hypothetical protein
MNQPSLNSALQRTRPDTVVCNSAAAQIESPETAGSGRLAT